MTVTTSKLKCLKLCFKKKMPTDTFPLQKKNQEKIRGSWRKTIAVHWHTFQHMMLYCHIHVVHCINIWIWNVSYEKKNLVHIFILNTIIIEKKKQIIDNGNNSHSKHKINIKLTIRQKSLFNTHVEYALHRHSSDI